MKIEVLKTRNVRACSLDDTLDTRGVALRDARVQSAMAIPVDPLHGARDREALVAE
jgi:hypothetical protein